MPTPHQHHHQLPQVTHFGVVNFLRHSTNTHTHTHTRSESRVARATRILGCQRTNQSQRDARAVWNGSDQVGAAGNADNETNASARERERERESKIERETVIVCGGDNNGTSSTIERCFCLFGGPKTARNDDGRRDSFVIFVLI